MTGHGKVDLWRNCPKTATEFEARFATEEDFRAYGTPDPRPALMRKFVPVFECLDGATSQAERLACH
jgi:hypothetical protein